MSSSLSTLPYHSSLPAAPLLYEVWPAKTTPACRGRFIIGPNVGTLLLNAGLIVAVSALFSVFVSFRLHIAVFVVFFPLPILALYCLALAAFSDPGIIPRKAEDPAVTAALKRQSLEAANETRRALGMALIDIDADTTTANADADEKAATPLPIANPPNTNEDANGIAPPQVTVPIRRPPMITPTQRVYHTDHASGAVTFTDMTLKYCSTCNIYRPFMASHCRECDQCVQAFDHHCPWISNCVGRRNHRYFVAFIFAVTAADVFVFVCSVVQFGLAAANDGANDAFTNNIVAVILFIFTFVIGWCLVSLSSYHVYLITEGLTTNAHIKQKRSLTATGQVISAPESVRVPAAAIADEHDDTTIYEPVDAPARADCLDAFYRFFCEQQIPSMIDMRAPINQQPITHVHSLRPHELAF